MREQVQELLLWARAERIQIGRVRVGDVELELVDLELLKEQPVAATQDGKDWEPKQPPRDPADLYAELARQRGLNVDANELREGAEETE